MGTRSISLLMFGLLALSGASVAGLQATSSDGGAAPVATVKL